jgi:hypothetical protein
MNSVLKEITQMVIDENSNILEKLLRTEIGL